MEQKKVIYSEDSTKFFSDFNIEKDLNNINNMKEIGVYFENEKIYQSIFDQTLKLICLICSSSFPNLLKLQNHLKSLHHKRHWFLF